MTPHHPGPEVAPPWFLHLPPLPMEEATQVCWWKNGSLVHGFIFVWDENERLLTSHRTLVGGRNRSDMRVDLSTPGGFEYALRCLRQHTHLIRPWHQRWLTIMWCWAAVSLHMLGGTTDVHRDTLAGTLATLHRLP